MSKKVLSREEKMKKYGNDIAYIGILYLVFSIINFFLTLEEMIRYPVNLVTSIGLIVVLFAMVIGCFKRKKYGVTAGWIFEILLIASSVLLLVLSGGNQGPDLIALIVMIWLPVDLKNFSKVLAEKTDEE